MKCSMTGQEKVTVLVLCVCFVDVVSLFVHFLLAIVFSVHFSYTDLGRFACMVYLDNQISHKCFTHFILMQQNR